MRHLPLALLLPAITSFVACGGAVATPDLTSGTTGGASSSSGGTGTGTGTGTSSGGTTSTSSSSSSGTVPLPEGAVDVCRNGTYRPLAGVILEVANAPEYLELREVWAVDGSNPRVVDTEGTICDGPQCQMDLTSPGWEMDVGGGMIQTRRYLVGLRKSGKIVAGTLPEVLGVIGVGSNEQAAFHATRTGKYRIVCDGAANVAPTTGGYVVRAESGIGCGAGNKVEEHKLLVSPDGSVTVQETRLLKEGDPNCAIGRKPEGLVLRDADRCADALGRFFAEAAYLEAASVVSFERLAAELTTLGAPRALVERSLASAADEVRHARTTAAIARRYGGDVADVEVAPARSRTVFEIALENAVEGCVRETYGALVAHWQASHAKDAKIRSAMKVIADDETRHAQLSLDVAAFLDTLLDDAERAAIATARDEAIENLLLELENEPDAALVRAAGMPRAADAKGLLTLLDAAHLRAAA